MKTMKALMLSGIIAAMFVFCSDDDSGGTTGGGNQTPAATGDYIGTWFASMPAVPPYLAEAVEITTKVLATDSAYSLIAIYTVSQDTALKHFGTWNADSSTDTLFLNGTECAIIDTQTRELEPLADCGIIPMFYGNIKDTVINGDSTKTWPVKLSVLTPLAPAFGIDLADPQMLMILNLITLNMVRISP